MPEPEPPQESDDAIDRAVDRHLAIFYRDSTLWPVLVTAIAAVVTLGASTLVFAVRERSPFALAALVVLAWVSADAVYRDLRQRRFGVASRVVVGLWVVATGAAVLASRLGFF